MIINVAFPRPVTATRLFDKSLDRSFESLRPARCFLLSILLYHTCASLDYRLPIEIRAAWRPNSVFETTNI